MTDPIGSVGRPPGSRRVRARRAGDAERAPDSAGPEAAHAATGADPVAPHAAGDPPPTVSAQVMGQAHPAEGAADPANAARQASSAYLSVEWSGGYDRRTGRGRIAKTKV